MRMYSDDELESHSINYKLKYRQLKKHLRALIYENERFQDELRKAQRAYLAIRREKTFLLDRILKFEKPLVGSSDSDATESSEDDETKMLNQMAAAPPPIPRKKITKRKRSEADVQNGASNQSGDSFTHFVPAKLTKPISSKPAAVKPVNPRKPKRPRKPSLKKERLPEFSTIPKGLSPLTKKPPGEEQLHMGRITDIDGTHKFEFDSQMTREDIERRLEARRCSPELELNTTATMPMELFSQDAEVDSDLEENEMCDYAPLDEDGVSADMSLE